MFLDETLIETAALRLFDDLWKFLGQAAHPGVTIYSSHGVFEATFSGEELDQPLGALTNVPWKRYRKKGLTLVYDLGEWMGCIITFRVAFTLEYFHFHSLQVNR